MMNKSHDPLMVMGLDCAERDGWEIGLVTRMCDCWNAFLHKIYEHDCSIFFYSELAHYVQICLILINSQAPLFAICMSNFRLYNNGQIRRNKLKSAIVLIYLQFRDNDYKSILSNIYLKSYKLYFGECLFLYHSSYYFTIIKMHNFHILKQINIMLSPFNFKKN